MTEHDKLAKIQPQSQAIGSFIEWLRSKGVNLMVYHDHSPACLDEDGSRACGYGREELEPYRRSIEQMLADYFKIDLAKLEQEKRSMLGIIRQVNDIEDQANKEGP